MPKTHGALGALDQNPAESSRHVPHRCCFVADFSFDPRQMIENEEFPGWGGPRYYEPALKITRENGDRDLVLRYVSHRIQQNNLDIELKDIKDDIAVTLHYRVYPEHGILCRNATIRNRTGRAVTVESAQSATWHMPPGEGYQLSYLTGRWAAETQINHEPIHPGMSKQAVLFAFRHSQQYNTRPPAIYLRGLDERAVYRVESIDGKLAEKQAELSGAFLMSRGLNVNLRGDFDSTAVILERVQ